MSHHFKEFPWHYYLYKLTKVSESLFRVCSLRLYKNLHYNNSVSQLMCHTGMRRSNTWMDWINRTKNTISVEKKGKTYQKYNFRRKTGKRYFTSDSWLTVYKNEATFPMVSQETKTLWSALTVTAGALLKLGYTRRETSPLFFRL